MNRKRYLLGFSIFLMMVFAACTPLTSASQDPTPRVVAIQPIVTEPYTEPSPTSTLEPTLTFTPEPTSTPKPTFTPAPTRTPLVDARATREADQARLETEIKEELEKLDILLDRGKLAWSSDGPISLSLETYRTYDLRQLGDGAEFSDFVLKADVTWESSGGLAICGFWLRGDSYEENAAHYLFQTIRLSGFPGWDVSYWKFHQWVSSVSPGGRVNTSPYIDQDQGATNTILIVVDGSLLTVYANGNRLGRMNVSTLSEGVLGTYISQESGETTCTWDDVWIWDLSAE